jgi:hypothetical protein
MNLSEVPKGNTSENNPIDELLLQFIHYYSWPDTYLEELKEDSFSYDESIWDGKSEGFDLEVFETHVLKQC